MPTKNMPVKHPVSRTWSQADCILCGGEAKRYGRTTGVRYGERYICGNCAEKKTFDRAGNVVDVVKKSDLVEQVHNCLLDMQEATKSNYKAGMVIRQLCLVLANHHPEVLSEVLEICRLHDVVVSDPLAD